MQQCQPKLHFTAALDNSAQCEISSIIIDSISKEATSNQTLIACSLAKALIRSPSVTRLNAFIMFCDTFVPQDEKSFYHIAQLEALYKKDASFDVGLDKRQVAFDSFLKAEATCRQLNRKLDKEDSDPNYGRRAALFHQMQSKISSCLGSLPPVPAWPCSFGPGANVGCNELTSHRFKLSNDATVTAGCVRLLDAYNPNTHAWPGLKNLRAVRGSYWTAVEKNYKTDRGICVEPIVNSFFQKGLGKLIRSRLQSKGVNLQDQSANQRLARKGSIDNSLATIDLSMASDTVSYNLVRDLLPWEWFDALDACRSPWCDLPDGSSICQSKFSSMGNGATFELESLIFWALCSSVCGSDAVISVYGDDIVVPSEHYHSVLDALRLCGFSPNDDKSFGGGPFRESCGKDFFSGTDVRPCFKRELWSVKEIFRFHNYCLRSGRLAALPPALRAFIPDGFLVFGPNGYGDGHLITCETPSKRDKRGWESFTSFRTFTAKPRKSYTVFEATCSDEFDYVESPDMGSILLNSSAENESSRTLYNVRASKPRFSLRTVRVPTALIDNNFVVA